MISLISPVRKKKNRKQQELFENAAAFSRNSLSKYSDWQNENERRKIIFFNAFYSSLETLQQNRRHSMFFQSVNLGEMVMCLEDLINYFAQPEDDMGLY